MACLGAHKPSSAPGLYACMCACAHMDMCVAIVHTPACVNGVCKHMHVFMGLLCIVCMHLCEGYVCVHACLCCTAVFGCTRIHMHSLARVSMCARTRMHVSCVHAHVCTYACLYSWCMSMHVCMCLCLSVRMCSCACVRVHMCASVLICMCVSVHEPVCV